MVLSLFVLASGIEAQEKTLTNSIGMKFVLIPAGSFAMGRDPNSEDGFDDEIPRHNVTISKTFYIGKYEVTQAQWLVVMGTNPSYFKGETNPVEQVLWKDIQEFLRRLNKKEGISQYRLPTEAEWEYACRTGTTTTYSFGDDSGSLGKYAWYDGNSNQETHPVGQLQPNAWGLFDMHGNVSEWVQDWYGEKYYTNSPSTDPQGMSSGQSHVHRGGSWYDQPSGVRSSLRYWYTLDYQSYFVGFRVVREQ